MPQYPITRAEISRSRLTENFHRLRALARSTPGTEGCDLLAVVKADAYGHGLSLCAPWLAEAGAEWLGVTSAEEGVAVRRLCPQARILVMRGLLPGEAEILFEADLTPTIWDLEHLEMLALAASQHGSAGGSILVHLEIDTGMSRQGVAWSAPQMEVVLGRLREIPALHLEGVFTHFASPEVLDSEQNSLQMVRFQHAVEQVHAAGFRPQWLHAGNSSSALGQQAARPLAALAERIGARCMVRPGIALYGYASQFIGEQAATANASRTELQPVLAWKTAIPSLRTVEAGTGVGYNSTFVAPKEMRLALLPMGYADGLNRKLSGGNSSNGGHVLVRGVAAPIVGRVSMDLTVVDVSHLPNVTIGDEVVILGEQNGQRVTADDHACWAETISYEILCAIGARVPRIDCI